MKRVFCILFIHIALVPVIIPQNSSFLVLGDTHYDLMEDHDRNWLMSQGDNLRQVNEYTLFTEKYWNDFMSVLRTRAQTEKPKVMAIVQLGDLSEGLAGTPEKARQMARNTMKAVDESDMPVPWIITKGNHDITGPGAREAFREYYVPMLRKQTGNPDITNASYSYRWDNVQITCIDPWDQDLDMVAFLEQELSASDARFKFVAIHEPVIPVTERCWHTMRREPDRREKLLEVIARNQAIVLCGHLHRYSVVSRETKFGTIVQVMTISVIRDSLYQTPKNVIREYGPSLADNVPEWQPETLESRKKILSEEALYVSHYMQTDLPGYSLIKVNEKKGTVQLEYYAAFGKKPYDTVNLTKLMQ
jgi:3',5'-cyclic AMP phosphodiesterase CpdA